MQPDGYMTDGFTQQQHFVCRIATEQAKMVALATQDRIDTARNWLETSAANILFVKEQLKPATIKGCVLGQAKLG